MNDRQFLEHMFDLTVRLTDAVENDGYRSDAYNAVLKEIAECGSKFNRRKRISRGVMNFVYIAAILFVLYLVYCLLSEGFGR